MQIACGLNGVQLIRKGDPLGGGRRKAEDMFDIEEDDDDDFLD